MSPAPARPLPRVHAITDAGVLALPDLGVRIAALAAAGPAVALHVRDRAASPEVLRAVAHRFLSHAHPPEASVFVNAHATLARDLGAHGLHLGEAEDSARARAVLGTAWHGWLGQSVHSSEGARRAAEHGAEYLMLGPIYATATHPGRAPLGPAVLEEVARLDRPVIAIGGVTLERIPELRAAGAYGVAAIRALWYAGHPAAAAAGFLEALL